MSGDVQSDKPPSLRTTDESSETSSDYDSTSTPPQVKYSVFRQPRAWWKHNYLSWRFYVTIYAFLALLASLVVLIALVAAAAAHGVDQQGRVLLFEGSCGSARLKSFFGHAFISGLGTYMLSASAYVMYCLTPPSREEVDREHARGKWLDIGAMSLRNLKKISKKRTTFFLLLGITSPILQLFFNSILFQTWSSNTYSALVVQEKFLEPGNFSIQIGSEPAASLPIANFFNEIAIDMHQRALDKKLDRLENKECIDAYAVPMQTNRRNVLVVTKNNASRADVFDAFEAPVPSVSNRDGPEQYSWLCQKLKLNSNDQCLYHTEHLRLDASLWTITDNAKIMYCLAERTEEHCKIQMSVPFVLIVFFICLFKSVVMFATAFFTYETPLMTTGDAIATFLNRPDRHTRYMCLASKDYIIKHKGGWRSSAPGYFIAKPKRWYSSNISRVASLILLMILGLCLAVALYTISNEPFTLAGLMAQGIGGINQRFFIGWHLKEQGGMFRSVALANLGHAIFGMLYIMYNNVFYAMIFSDEWARYGWHRKGLRVSESPRGQQRTVYFFLMPYKIAFVIIAFSCAIHTCISQTLFLVDVETYGSTILSSGVKSTIFGRQRELDFTTTGFSPLANLLLIFLSLLMIGYLVWMSCRKLKSGMPVTSTCSAAISANCHPGHDEVPDAYLYPIQWGVTHTENGIGHTSFSCRLIKPAREGYLYI